VVEEVAVLVELVFYSDVDVALGWAVALRERLL